jgi:hypothetical protein
VKKSEEVTERGWRREGGVGRLTSAPERVGVGESFVELRPWPPEGVVRLRQRSFSGVGHRVGRPGERGKKGSGSTIAY